VNKYLQLDIIYIQAYLKHLQREEHLYLRHIVILLPLVVGHLTRLVPVGAGEVRPLLETLQTFFVEIWDFLDVLVLKLWTTT